MGPKSQLLSVMGSNLTAKLENRKQALEWIKTKEQPRQLQLARQASSAAERLWRHKRDACTSWGSSSEEMTYATPWCVHPQSSTADREVYFRVNNTVSSRGEIIKTELVARELDPAIPEVDVVVPWVDLTGEVEFIRDDFSFQLPGVAYISLKTDKGRALPAAILADSGDFQEIAEVVSFLDQVVDRLVPAPADTNVSAEPPADPPPFADGLLPINH